MTNDFKNQRKWTEADENGLEDFMKRMLLAFLMFCAIVTAFAVLEIPEAAAVMPVIAPVDYLVSPEMAEYMVKQGSGFIHRDWDMD